jgi:hypothetical protein
MLLACDQAPRSSPRRIRDSASNIVCDGNALRRTEHSRLSCASPRESSRKLSAPQHPDAARLVQHRFDEGPFKVAEFEAQ